MENGTGIFVKIRKLRADFQGTSQGTSQGTGQGASQGTGQGASQGTGQGTSQGAGLVPEFDIIVST